MSRRGLARRLQDNVSWAGPGVVVCVERDANVPKKVWVRIRTKVKAYPLEKIRLATADEMIGAEYISAALRDVQQELEVGRLQVASDPGVQAQGSAPVPALTDQPLPLTDAPKRSAEDDAVIQAQGRGKKAKAEKVVQKRSAEPAHLEEMPLSKAARETQQKRRELLHDVPQVLELPTGSAPSQLDPHEMSYDQKKLMFEKLGAELKTSDPTLREVQLRAQLEEATSEVKRVRKQLKQQAQQKSKQAAFVEEDQEQQVFELEVLFAVPGGWKTLEEHMAFWTKEEVSPDLEKKARKSSQEAGEEAQQGQLVTGKLRVEMRWQDLSEEWQAAFHDPLLKAVQIYFDYKALGGVKKDQVVDPRKILPSRFVLTNKGGKELLEALLKARWVLGGHRDEEVGKYPTMAPTASLLGHNLLNFIAVRKDWVIYYEDVSSAFLQGKPLPDDREVYVKIPAGYPQYVIDYILKQLGGDAGLYRGDLLRLLKGGFGLAESPRLWYLEYKATLQDIGLQELKLVPGMFRALHEDGSLRALVTIHVDDTRYAGDASAQQLWDELHRRLQFGKLRKATDGWQKFCGRWERQDLAKGELYYSMDEYTVNIPEVKKEANHHGENLSDWEKKQMGSVLGQLNWAARQGRYELAYGVSHCQQLAALGKREVIELVNKLVKKSKISQQIIVRKLGCELDEMVVLSASDAAFAAQPKACSQGGLVCMLANPKIMEKPAEVAILEAQSMKINRVVRCSMSAELSTAAEAFEHGDFMRAVMAEVLLPGFDLKRWKWHASMWRHFLVIDAKTGFDVLNSECLTSDRKIMIDAAALREAIMENGANNFVKWVPGHEMVSDGLTKWSGNEVLEKVMIEGYWCLSDTPEARQLREQAAARKRSYNLKRKQQWVVSCTKGGGCQNDTETTQPCPGRARKVCEPRHFLV